MALFKHLLLKQSRCKGTKTNCNILVYNLTEVYSPDAVSNSVQRRGPTHHSHDVRDHQQYGAGHPRFGRHTHLGDERCGICFRSTHEQAFPSTAQASWSRLTFIYLFYFQHTVTHMKSHLAGEVIHATRVHETQSVSHCLGTQDTLACDWADPSVGQSGGQDTSRFAGHLDGAELKTKRGETTESIFINIKLQIIDLTHLHEKLHSWRSSLPGSRSPGHRSYPLPEENTGEWNMIIVIIWSMLA